MSTEQTTTPAAEQTILTPAGTSPTTPVAKAPAPAPAKPAAPRPQRAVAAPALIIPNNSEGNPFETYDAAAMEQKCSPDRIPGTHIIVKANGKFVLMDPAMATTMGMEAYEQAEDLYFVVKVGGQADDEQPKDVELTVNMECLHGMRGVDLVLPAPFLECMHHTGHSQYNSECEAIKGEGGRVRTYPYEIVGRATKEMFDTFMKEKDPAKKLDRNKIIPHIRSSTDSPY